MLFRNTIFGVCRGFIKKSWKTINKSILKSKIENTHSYTNGPTSFKIGLSPFKNLFGFVTLKKYILKRGVIGGFFHTSTIFDPSLSGIS